MTLWSKIIGGDGSEKEKPVNKSPRESSRFYYDSGEKENLQLFKGLAPHVRSTLRSLYLEKCNLDGDILVRSLDGCENLTTIRLLDVSIHHESIEVPVLKFQKLHLPQLKILHVSDYSDRCQSILDRPFHKISSQAALWDQEKFAQYNVEFYSQFLQYQLSRLGCRLLFNCKFFLCGVDLTLSLNGYKILKYSPLESYEKLIISPWLDNVKNQFLRDPSDRSQVKHLACSDSIFTAANCPENLEDLNLFVCKDHPSLVTEPAGAIKFLALTTLTLQLHHRTIVDISVLSECLRKLTDLAITNAVIHGTRKRPLRLDCCYFDQCVFSEAFVNDVPSYLDCARMAIDVAPTHNWTETFKPQLMLIPTLMMLAVYQISTDEAGQEQLFDPVMYTKMKDGEWNEGEFRDAASRRNVFFSHRDFFQDRLDLHIPSHQRSTEAPASPSVLLNPLNPQSNSNVVSFFLICATAYVLYYYLVLGPSGKKDK